VGKDANLYARKNAEFYMKRETVLRARKLACPTDMESRPPSVLQGLKTDVLCVKKIIKWKLTRMYYNQADWSTTRQNKLGASSKSLLTQ